jgi:hypothetical protein
MDAMATVYRDQSFKKTSIKNSLKINEDGENIEDWGGGGGGFNTGNLSFVLKKKHSNAPQGPPLFL